MSEAVKLKDDPKPEQLRFKDAAGREWYCRVDFPAIRRCDAAGVPLEDFDNLLPKFFSGSALLADALWGVLSPEAEKQGITKDTFESGICGAAAERALNALQAGFELFCQPQRAAMLRANRARVELEIQNAVNL